jgi:putative nucleotidyltransferase with HDIG domain
VISESNTLIDLLNVLNKHSDFVYAHSVGVAMYSIMLANKLGFNSSQNIFKLSLAGIFHDIGKKEINREILEKSRLLMTAQERVEFETHVIRGKEILDNIRTFPGDVIQMVYEHHEDCLGQGYPKGVSKNDLHPLSKILSLSNRFAELTLRSAGPQQPMTAPIAVYHLESTSADRFDKLSLDALKALVKQ